MTSNACLLALAILALAAPASAAPLPDGIRAMIDKAAESDDPTVIGAVLAVARQAAPDSLAEIDVAAAEASAALAQARIAEASPELAPPPKLSPALIELPELAPKLRPKWTGAVELGGARLSGAADLLGAYGSVDVTRAMGDWTQRVSAKADYQETDGVKTTERLSLAYRPQLRLNPGLYGYGVAQYDHDRFLGYRNRYTVGLGAGFTLVERPDFRIALDAGPALRYTQFYALEGEHAVAGRGSLTIKWLPSRRITLSQEGAIYVEGAQTSAKSTTSVETLLFGPLKGRLSYDVQHERDDRINRSDIDTSTRASILYNF